jgi:arabinofuranan 3-O-arabinosyltransferase
MESASPSVEETPRTPLGARAAARVRGAIRWDVVSMAIVSYVPLLLTHRGMVPADTKQYLYLDPGQLLDKAPSLWDPSVGLGTVTHQNIGYLWPMGPWYWLFDTLGFPDWVAQRLWLGTLLFVAGLGVRYLMNSRGYRGWAVTAASFTYLLSPYSLHYAARISALLMPWSALPWLIALTASALVRPRLWKSALIALIVATARSVNLTSLLYVLIGPLLWILWSWIVLGETDKHRLWRALWPTALLGGLTSAWSLAGLVVQGGFGVPIVGFTETLQAVSVGSAAQEVLRGLGYWFFYGNDNLGPWIEPAVDYTQHLWLLGATFGVVLVALAGATFSRFPERGFVLWMMLGGAIVAVGAHPWDNPTVAGQAFIDASKSSESILALRSTARAVPLVALALALLSGAFVGAFADRTSHVFANRRRTRLRAELALAPRSGLGTGGPQATEPTGRRADRRRVETGSARAAGLVVIALGLVAQPSLWMGDMVGSELQRDEDVPSYWKAAAQSISTDADTRVWELPGIDFASYRWGNTVDPITPGLTDRATVARELIPLGGSYPMDLLAAADRRMQEQIVDWDAIGPIAGLMNADTLLVRNDLAFERYGTPRPEVLSANLNDQRVDLAGRQDFGTDVDLATDPRLGGHNESELAALDGMNDVPAVFTVEVENARNIHAAVPAQGGFVLDGAGEGIVDLAGQGVLDTDPLILYSHAIDDATLRQAVSSQAELVVSDSFRKQGRRWGSVRDNAGYTELAGEEPLEYDPSDARLPGTSGWPEPDDADMTVSELEGPLKQVQASDYGNVVSLTPGDRPQLAVDGDLSTAWRVDAFGPAIDERLVLTLDQPTDISALKFVQPLSGSRNRWITSLEVDVDGETVGLIELDRSSRQRDGQIVRFPTRTDARKIELRVADTNVGEQLDYRRYSGVGFSEVEIGVPAGDDERWLGPTVEWTVLPTQSIERLGKQVGAFSVLMSRRRGNASEVTHPEEESVIRRRFTVDRERTFAIEGSARLSPFAGEVRTDALLGVPRDSGAASSGALPGSITSRAHAAFDGDPATAWQTSFRTPVTGGFDEPVWLQYGTAEPAKPARARFTILTDGRHSIPQKVQVTADRSTLGTFELATPTSTELKQGYMVRTIELGLNRPAHEFRFSFSDVEPVESQGTTAPLEVWFPVGIAEVQLSQVPALPGPRQVNACRNDLATLDGQPLSLRIFGDGSDAVRLEPLQVELCGRSARLNLQPGEHELETTAGATTGIDLDRLWLRSAADGTALSDASARPPDLAVRLESNSSDHDVITTNLSGPTWIVLGESYNLGWTASAKGGDKAVALGEPTVFDGFANAWLVNPEEIGTGTVTIEFTWKPQKTVDRALALSAIGTLAALGLLIWDRRRDRTPTGELAPAASVSNMRTVRWASPMTVGGTPDGALIALGLLLNALLLIFLSPTAVLVAVPIELLAGVLARPRLVPAAGLLAIAGAALVVVFSQWANAYPAQFDWPTRFPAAHWLTNLGLALLAGSALWESRVRFHRRIQKRRIAAAGRAARSSASAGPSRAGSAPSPARLDRRTEPEQEPDTRPTPVVRPASYGEPHAERDGDTGELAAEFENLDTGRIDIVDDHE